MVRPSRIFRPAGTLDGAGQEPTPGMDRQEKEQEPDKPQPPSWADRLRERTEARAVPSPPADAAPERKRRPERSRQERKRAPSAEAEPSAGPRRQARLAFPMPPFVRRFGERAAAFRVGTVARAVALRQAVLSAFGRAHARVGSTRFPRLQRRQLIVAGVGLGAFLLGALTFGFFGAGTDLARFLSGAAILDEDEPPGVTGAAPALVLHFSAAPDPVPAGDLLTYTLSLTNTGEVTLTLTLLDVAPAQVTSGGALYWTPIVPPAAIWTHTFSVTVSPSARGVLTSVVLAAAREGVSAAYTVTTPVVDTPRVAVGHRPAGPARAGDRLTYTVRVTNTGNVDLHTVVTATLPAGGEAGPVHTWQPMIPGPAAHRPAGVWSTQVAITVPVGYAGALASRVEVATREGVSAASDHLAIVRAVPALVVVHRAHPDPATAGARLTYTLAVTNTGNVDLHPAVTATLPAQVTPVGVLPDNAGGTLTWAPPTLAPGNAWHETMAVTVTPGYAGTLTDVVHVSTAEGAAALSTLAVQSLAPRVAIGQAAAPQPARPGELLTFTLAITNTGNALLHCAVVDLPPAAARPATAGTAVAPIQRWSVTLPPAGRPGAVWTDTLVLAVAADYTGPLTNIVEVTSLEGASAVHTATILARASRLEVVTLAEPDPVFSGSFLTYTLAITNAGNAPVLITVRDTLPADVIPVLPLPAPSSAPVQHTGDMLVWAPVTLPPAGLWTVTVPVSVPATCSGVLTNVLALGTPDGTDTYTLTSLAYASALTVSQSVEPRVVVAGEPLTYTLRITNLGNVDLHAAVLDYLPAPITPSLPVAWWIVTIPAPEVPGSTTEKPGPAQGVWITTVTITPTEDYATINLTDTLANYVEIVTFEGDWLVHTHTLSIETAPAALAITTTAPTLFGQPTILTATIAAGNLVYYTWNLGDGSPLVSGYENMRRGSWLAHTYPAPGLYTVTLTATNSYGAATATIPVDVYIPFKIYLPLVYDLR
ncbi:MAG: DUF11 domain-containing protein [Anaerolineae bacterium]|nr:DUF11 domain-containing protein [Anaerolineae bacterium]